MFIRKVEYSGMEKNYAAEKITNDRLRDELKQKDKEIEKLKDEITNYRIVLRKLKKKMEEEKGNQNYGSVMNVLNKLQTFLKTIETGD